MGSFLSLWTRKRGWLMDAFTGTHNEAYITQVVLAAAVKDDVHCLQWYHSNTRKGILDLRCSKTSSTPLHVSALNNSTKCLDFLLSIGCDPNTGDGSGEVPLHLAAKAGSVECLKSLIDHKSRLNIRDNWGRTPLLKAIVYNKRKAAYFLMAVGCNPNIQDEIGLSPLHVAASYGQKNLLVQLIENGAVIDAADKKGRTPLCSAVNGSKFEIALELLKKGARTTYKNDTYTVVKDAFLKLVNAKPDNKQICMRVTSLVLSAHGNFLLANEWGDPDLIGNQTDVSSYVAVLRKMAACFKGNVRFMNGIFHFKQFFVQKPQILTLEEMTRNLLRQEMMKPKKNVLWACDGLDINCVLKDIILINNIFNY